MPDTTKGLVALLALGAWGLWTWAYSAGTKAAYEDVESNAEINSCEEDGSGCEIGISSTDWYFYAQCDDFPCYGKIDYTQEELKEREEEQAKWDAIIQEAIDEL